LQAGGGRFETGRVHGNKHAYVSVACGTPPTNGAQHGNVSKGHHGTARMKEGGKSNG
jgi:hypothetical protein